MPERRFHPATSALRWPVLAATLAVLAVVVSSAGFFLNRPPPEPPQHLLFVVIDALRADGLSLHGNPLATSPSFEALADEALVFERAWAQGTYTQSSFWSYMTSSYVRSHGWDYPVPGPLPEVGLCHRDDLHTLAEVLSNQGFVTRAMSVNAFLKHEWGFPRGFDSWNARGWTPPADAKKRKFSLIRECRQRIRRWHDGQRHFLYVHAMEPHLPLEPSKAARERFGLAQGKSFAVKDVRRLERQRSAEEEEQARRYYHAEVWDADRFLQRLLQVLERQDLLDETLVVVSSDHGERLFQHDTYGHRKGVWQELVHVPLLLRAPGLEPGRVARPVELVDLAPTIMRLLGLEGAIPEAWQGEDLLDQDAQPLAVSERLGEVALALDGRLKGVRDAQGGWQVFDLEQDPTEQHPLQDAGAILERLRMAYAHWAERTPIGEADQQAEPVGMCRQGKEKEESGEELSEEQEALRELGYLE